MHLPDEFQNYAAYLSVTNVDLYKFIDKHRQFLERRYFADMDLHQKNRKLQPWPTFIDKDKLNYLRKVNVALFHLIVDIPYRLFENNAEKIAAAFNLPRKFVEFYIKGYDRNFCKNFIGRGDFIYNGNNFNLIEFNATTTIGGLEIPLWEKRCISNSLIKKFITENDVNLAHYNYTQALIEHLIDSSHINHPSKPLHLAIFDYGTEDNDYFPHLETIYQDVLHRKSINGKILFCNPANIDIGDDHVFFDGKKIDIMLEFKNGLISRDLANLMYRKKLYILNGPASGIFSNKHNIAFLSEHADSSIFNDDEKMIIQKHIPWTRKIRDGKTTFRNEQINLVPFIVENKDKLILKPAAGHAGLGIVAGKETAQEVWIKKIDKALKNNDSIIQEFLLPKKLIYQFNGYGYRAMNTVFGVLTFGSRYGGCLLRVKPEEDGIIINSRQDAEVGVVLECIS